jgi:hypothetical protein
MRVICPSVPENRVPISYRIDALHGVVHVAFHGRVTLQEFRANRAALMSDPQFSPAMHRLTDLRELTDLPSMDELRDLAHVVTEARKREPEGVRRGVLVGSPAAYGAIRQYQAFLWMANLTVDILSSDEEARTWLAGLPAPVSDDDA